MPTARWTFSANVVNGRIYAIGGDNLGAVMLPTVEIYDPVKDKWTAGTDMPTLRSHLASSSVNSKIYVIGGTSVWPPAHLSTVEEYTPEGWPFSVSPQLKLPTKWGAEKERRGF